MKKLKHILIAALLLAGAGACTANFDEYNTNPNEMDLWKIAPAGMIQELLYSGTEVFLYRTWQLNGELIQYTIAGSGNNTYHRYVVENSVGASAWSNLYKQAANADHMRQLAIRKEDPNYEAIALTLRTLFLQNIADLFGDVPCSEAFKGPSENVKQPVFDTQEQVYRSLLADLERANSLYDNSVALSSATRDLLYKGDLTKWRKFNNSLYLRLLMRLSNRNAAVGVAAKIAEVFDNPDKYPVFTGNEDNAEMRYDEVEPFVNYWGTKLNTQFTTSTGRRPAEQIIGMATLGEYGSPYALMKYDEVLFIFAEAMQRGWIAGDAGTYYRNAIRASVKYWDGVAESLTIPDVVIENFLANVPYDGTLETIIDQKYVALFWVGYEAWAEYRRTGYPALEIGSGTFNDHILPTRLVYPTNTVETNKNNYNAAVERLRSYYGGADDMKTPVWWSKAAVDKGIR